MDSVRGRVIVSRTLTLRQGADTGTDDVLVTLSVSSLGLNRVTFAGDCSVRVALPFWGGKPGPRDAHRQRYDWAPPSVTGALWLRRPTPVRPL